MKFGNYELVPDGGSLSEFYIHKDGNPIAWGRSYPDALVEIIHDLQGGLFIVEEQEINCSWSYDSDHETLEDARRRVETLKDECIGRRTFVNARIIKVIQNG